MTEQVLNTQLAAQLRGLLRAATPRTVPSGVLVWWGTGPLPDGRAATPALDQPAWEACYMRLEGGALGTGIVPPLAKILATLAPRRPDGQLPVAIARFRHAVPRPEFVAEVRQAAQEGRALRPAPSKLDGLLEEREGFISCGLLHEQWGMPGPAYRGHRIPFLVTEKLLLSNPGGSRPDAIEIDPGDGRGFQKVELETPLVVDYGGASTANVAVRCSYGPDTLMAGFTMPLSEVPAAPAPDESWPLRADCGNTGTAYVHRARGATRVQHPLIMVEGFPGGHAADYLYDTLNQQGTADSLRAAGYDIVIVGLDQGTDLIQRNAEVLVACIRAAKERTEERLVVGGVSMGGLVSRYALLAMEARGEAHNACVFLTIDTPHAGSYTSLGAQWFVQTFAPYLPGLPTFAWLLDSPANQQFDMSWVHAGTAQTSPLREAFVRELTQLGDYPKGPRLLAASCGRGDGVRSAPPGVRTLSWSGEPWLSIGLSALAGASPQTLAHGSWFLADPQQLAPLRSPGDIAWDVAPGGQDPYNAEAAAIALGSGCGAVEHDLDYSCAVPTVSALDLDTDPFAPVPPPGSEASPFEDYAFCDTNQPHLTITPELSAWLLKALGSPCLAEQDTSNV